jgi:hypothetical protein
MAQTEGVSIKSNVSPPHPSAMLDVESSNKGVLTPRVALQATNISTPVTNPAISLLVYNTATAGVFPNSVVPGFYFWDGTQWRKLVAEEKGRSNGGVVPVGGIIMWSGDPTQIPPGYQLCDGADITNILSPLIGNKAPDLQGKFIVGYHKTDMDYAYNPSTKEYKTGPDNPNTSDYVLVDDKKRVQLKIPAMPNHEHPGNTEINGQTVNAQGETGLTTEVPSSSIDIPTGEFGTHYDKRGDEYVSITSPPTATTIPPEQPHKHDINGNMKLTGSIVLKIPDEGNGMPIENRPAFYTLAYVIRIF